MLSFRADGSTPVLTFDGDAVAVLADAEAGMTGLYLGGEAVRLEARRPGPGDEGADGVYEAAGWTVRDSVEIIPGGLARVRRTWHNRGTSAQKAVLVFELYRRSPVDFTLIPAVSYNGNGWGGGSEPKGFVDPGSPGSPSWIFGGDRASIPACTITAGGGGALMLFTAPELAAESGCGLIPAGAGDSMACHQVRWPLQELPRSYTGRDKYGPAISTEVEIEGGATCSREVYIAFQPVRAGEHDFSALFSSAWRLLYHPVQTRFTPRDLWQLGVRYAREGLWHQDETFSGFVLGRILRDGAWVLPGWIFAEIGWCGQNSTLAAMFLQDFLWSGDEDSWRRGEAALEWWRDHCALPNGLFITHIDCVEQAGGGARLETCNLGGGAYAYLLASELAEKAGRPRPQWRQMGLDCCDFFVRNCLADGRFGRYWSPDGKLLEAEGTVGSWMIWPLLKAYRLTGQPDYLQAARRAFEYYTAADLAAFQITAGALDTDCIDKEGAFPLLMGGLELYELTGEPEILARTEQAAVYLATWQWHYSLVYPAGTAAAQIGYETFGGTSVSVQHHHLDPWGVLIALGWLRLGRLTGKAEWSERGAAAWKQGAYGVSDGTLSVDGVTRPAGGQDEGFLHTRWGKSRGGVSNWCVAWPTAFRLFVLSQWDNWDDLT
jgi:hypothetical protein